MIPMRFRSICSVLAVVAALLGAVPAMAQSGSNPTAEAVSERQLFQEHDRIQGRITIPDPKAAILEQPEGRDYRAFHEGALPWIGAIAVIGMLLLLAFFYFYRGRVRTNAPESGIKIQRFNAFERFTHWMTATAFIVLAITGLNYVFGKRLLMPLLGPDAFANWSQWAKYAHNFMAVPFILGVLIMLVVWIKDNFPERHDWTWLKAGGGFLDKSNKTHPPASRFNAGQKLIFWAVILGGGALSVSGVWLLFPFSLSDVNGMQTAQYIHAVIGMVMIAVILAHIYIGTLGMVGAYEAMGSGEVDLTWAKEHHKIWVEREQARTQGGRRQVPPRGAPAE